MDYREPDVRGGEPFFNCIAHHRFDIITNKIDPLSCRNWIIPRLPDHSRNTSDNRIESLPLAFDLQRQSLALFFRTLGLSYIFDAAFPIKLSAVIIAN